MQRLAHVSLDRPARRISATGDLYTVLVSGEETGGAYAVIHAQVPPGGGPPPHSHSREEEGFYLLSGELTVVSDGRTVRAVPGAMVNLPRGSVHQFKNESTRPAEMLITVVPAGFEKFLEEFGTVLDDSQTEALPMGPEESQRILEAAPKYGITLAAPGH